MDLGPHAAFIWISYAAVVAVLAARIVWLIADGRTQQRKLDDMEARGVRRRSRGHAHGTRRGS
jgi:heme exporter protein D